MSSISDTGAGPATAPTTSYTPTTPGDWSSVPVNVQQALDMLAALAANTSSDELRRYALLVGEG